MIQTNIFLDEIYSFLRTVSIKNTYIADHIRSSEIIRRNVDDLADVDNPYYINLIGDYSPIDTEMTIKSLDFPDTTIVFNKENLELHPKTKFAYRVDGRWFNNLISRFPEQSDLIKNILYPVPLLPLSVVERNSVSTDAQALALQKVKTINHLASLPNFSLLHYDLSQLEPQETSSMITVLEQQLSYFRTRWDVADYQYEEFFPITLWSLLWTTLPNLLLMQRVKNLKTTSVHTTHIWEYLTSKGIGDYRSILTRQQQMFLYKNIEYIIKTRGKDGTLNILADELLKPQHVTLKSKSLILNSEDMEENGVPTAEIISSDIRDKSTPSQDGENGYETVETIFGREFADFLEPIYDEQLITDQEERFSHMKETWLPTKLVELNRIDLNTSNVKNFFAFLIETFLYRQSLETIDYNITIRPKDTEIDLNLSPGEVIALLAYCSNREFAQGSVMTADAIDAYVGLEIINSEGDKVLVTEGNKASFIGEYIEFRSLTQIPTSARLTLPYKDVMPSDFDRDFEYSGITYKSSRVLDIDGKTSRIKTNIGNIPNNRDFIDLIDEHFGYMVKDLEGLRSNQNASYHIGFDLLYSQMQINGFFDLNLGINYTEYDEWFENSVQLEKVIDQYNESPDVKILYSELANDLIELMFPLERVESVVFSTFTANDFRLMKQLFIQLCSYNIAFLETDPTEDSYHRFTPIVIRDQLERELDLETTYKLPNIYEYFEHVYNQEHRIKSNARVSPRSIQNVVIGEQSYGGGSKTRQIEVVSAPVVLLHQKQSFTDHIRTGEMSVPYTVFGARDTPTEIISDVARVNQEVPNYFKSGLKFNWYQLSTNLYQFPDYDNLPPAYPKDYVFTLFQYQDNIGNVNIAGIFEGFVYIPEETDWKFIFLHKSGGIRFYIDDYLLIENINPSLSEIDIVDGIHYLTKGLHRVKMETFVRQGPYLTGLMGKNSEPTIPPFDPDTLFHT